MFLLELIFFCIILGNCNVRFGICIRTFPTKDPLHMWAQWVFCLDNRPTRLLRLSIPASKLLVEILADYFKLFLIPKFNSILASIVKNCIIYIWHMLMFIVSKNIKIRFILHKIYYNNNCKIKNFLDYFSQGEVFWPPAVCRPFWTILSIFTFTEEPPRQI